MTRAPAHFPSRRSPPPLRAPGRRDGPVLVTRHPVRFARYFFAAVSASDVVLVFDWDTTQRRRLTIAGFLLASVLLHVFCFYVFQIIYPPAVALLPPPGRVSVIAPNSEENGVLLSWIKAEDTALESNTHLPADARIPALPVVQSDERWLAHVLVNLVSNAVKFTPEGERVNVPAYERGTAVLIAVDYSGNRNARTERERLVHPVSQVESPES